MLQAILDAVIGRMEPIQVETASQLQASTVREKEKIEGMPDLPTIENLDAWRMKSRECIATTSSAPDKARIWMKECDNKSEEDLKDSSPFHTLDQKIFGRFAISHCSAVT